MAGSSCVIAAHRNRSRWQHEREFLKNGIFRTGLAHRSTRLFGSWEALLFAVAVLIFIANSFASPYFLNAWNLSDATFNFTEKAMVAFAMALLIIAGEIDLSVAAIIALASTAMGAAAQAGSARRASLPSGSALVPGAA